MNRLDIEIMKALLIPQKSMYSLEKFLKENIKESNYATVYRHVKKLQREGLLSSTGVHRKNGKQDKRGTRKLEVTEKGLATLMIEGDVRKEDLESIARKIFHRNYPELPSTFLHETKLDNIFANVLLKTRHKINLKFFDEAYFKEVIDICIIESVLEKRKDLKLKRRTRAKVLRLKKKNFAFQFLEGFKEMRQLFVRERDKFNKYLQLIDSLSGIQ